MLDASTAAVDLETRLEFSRLDSDATLVQQLKGVIDRELPKALDLFATSAQEQATGLQEVNAAVGQMDQMTQQNAAMAEQASAASQSLRRESAQLSALIDGFDLGGRRPDPRSDAPVVARQEPVAPAPSRAPRAPKVARGNAALAVQQNEWAEF